MNKLFIIGLIFIAIITITVITFTISSDITIDPIYTFDIPINYIDDAYNYAIKNNINLSKSLSNILIDTHLSSSSNNPEKILEQVLTGIIDDKTHTFKAFHPFPKTYQYQHLNNFDSYDKGNDFLTDENTPIVCIENSNVEKVGWIDAGGWRIVLKSVDKKRYYYFGHMKNYKKAFKSGDFITAGEVIGHVGNSGYGPINTFGKIPSKLYLMIRVSYSVGSNTILTPINPYSLLKFLEQNKINP